MNNKGLNHFIKSKAWKIFGTFAETSQDRAIIKFWEAKYFALRPSLILFNGNCLVPEYESQNNTG